MMQFKVWILLVVANAAPILGGWICNDRFGFPVDGGRRWADGRPWFGSAKTVRGVILSLALTMPAAMLLDLPWFIGMQIAGFAMLGDLTSSFIKRRLGLPPSSMALGLDQIPESLFPLLVVQARFGFTLFEIAVMTLAFLVFELLISRLLFQLRLRNRPY